MSAWPDRPDDFVAAGHEAGAFAPRRDYGAYLQAILEQAVAKGVDLVEARASSAVRDGGGWRVTLDDGRVVAARALVLAQGNQPPEPMRVGDGIDPVRFVNNPWGEEARAAVTRVAAEGGDVLILGTGLTMVDMVLSLDAAGHRGRIVALSRRGQMPRAHAPHEAAPVGKEEVPHGNVLALWRWLRARGASVGWRAAVDSLRPHAQALWRGLDAGEQRRFLRHARPYWDVHRHRIAPQVAGQLKGMIAEGRLEVVAGRVLEIGQDEDELVVSYVRRGRPLTPLAFGESPATGESRPQRLSDRPGDDRPVAPAEGRGKFSVVFNCTGPLGSMERTRDPLLRQMIDEGSVAIDRLGMGLAVDAGSRAGDGVWALGPLTKGEFWEIVAVPDIREQVAAVAADIAGELGA